MRSCDLCGNRVPVLTKFEDGVKVPSRELSPLVDLVQSVLELESKEAADVCVECEKKIYRAAIDKAIEIKEVADDPTD